MSYPEAFKAPVRQAYPDIFSISLTMDVNAALKAAVAASSRLGWEIVPRDDSGRTFEVTDTSMWFRVVDDWCDAPIGAVSFAPCIDGRLC